MKALFSHFLLLQILGFCFPTHYPSEEPATEAKAEIKAETEKKELKISKCLILTKPLDMLTWANTITRY